MKIQVKFTLLLATTFCATAAFAQMISIEKPPTAPPERALILGAPYTAEILSQIGVLTDNETQGVNGIALRAALAAAESPVQLDDGYTRRTIREIPGERIDMRTGALSLSATDLLVPGDGGMGITLGRTRRSTFFNSEDATYIYERKAGELIGDWELQIPYIQLVTIGSIKTGPTSFFPHTPFSFGGVCERPLPPNPFVSGLLIPPNQQTEAQYREFFNGVQIGGLGDTAPVELLTVPIQRLTSPRTYFSTENWVGVCADSQYSIGTFHPKSKFVVKAPNGYVYEFDEPTEGTVKGVVTGGPAIFGHMRIFLSKVTDTNGNWTKYVYNNDLFLPDFISLGIDFRDYAYLDHIETSDGKRVDLTWECNKYSNGANSTTNCPGPANRPGIPFYRLKNITYKDKVLNFKYSDSLPSPNIGRYLTSVEGPNGSKIQYSLSFPANAPAIYQQSLVSGATIKYGIAIRKMERGANYNVGWFGSAVVSRSVDDLDGPIATTKYCYTSYLSDGNSPGDVSTYAVEPTRTSKYSFQRERRWDPAAGVFDANAWKEGLPTAEKIFDPVDISTACSSVVAETGLIVRSSEQMSWGRSAPIVVSTPPFYPEATSGSRRVTQTISNTPDGGTYSSVSSDFDELLRPRTQSDTIANSTTARVVKKTYVPAASAAGRLDLVDTVTVDGITGLVDNDYDARGNLTSTTNYGVTSTFGYFANGNLQWAEDARAKRTNFGNYRFGQPQSVTNPDLTTAVQVVDDYGRTTSLINERGIATSFTYDLLDRLATVTPTIGPTTKITWSSDFRTKTTQRLGRATKGAAPVLRTDVYQFDALGRLTQETQAGTLVTKLGYDEVGRQKYVTDVGNGAAVARTETTYDALDRARTTSRFDAANAIVSSTSVDFSAPETRTVTDANGNTSTSTYRSFGAPNYEQMLTARTPVTVISPVGVAALKSLGTDFSPDILGFSPSVVQGEQNSKNQLIGQVRRYALNAKRQMMSEYAPEIAGTNFDGLYNVSYCRDEIGNILAKSLNTACVNAATANLVSSQYDDRNRITAVNYANNSAPSKSILYSDNSNVEKVTRGNGVILDPEYNELDQLKQQDYLIDQFKFRVKFAFDTLQNVKTITYPSGKVITLDPDALGRVKKISPYVSNIDYFEIGAPKEITYANGQKTTATLTTQNGVDTLKTEKTGITAINLDYGYDLNNNPTSVSDALNPGDNLEAQYDQLNRLVKQNYLNLPNGTNMYRSYDAIGNVLFDRSPEGDVSFNYDTSSNRLLSASSSNPSVFPNHSYTYDRLGNVQSDGIRTLNFNAASELSSGSRNGQSKAITYDGAERILKEVANGETHYLVHLGENLVLDFNSTTNKYTEYAYLGNQLVGSRVVANAAVNDSDGDGKTDLTEFQTPD
jgi:YD repeat-containing protein